MLTPPRIEAQTLANLYLALDHDLEIIPVINKIDLPNADIDRVVKEIEDIIGIGREDIILASAKMGHGTEDILEALVNRVPPPVGDSTDPLRALIFDSVFDSYRGAVPFVRIVDGMIEKDMQIKMMSTVKLRLKVEFYACS